MTAVSIPRATGIAPPKPVKTDSAPATGGSAFTIELQTAIEERKPRNKDAKQQFPENAGSQKQKKDDLPLPAPVIASPLSIVPPLPAGAFGLPAAGIEPGAKTDGAAMQVASDQPPPETSALNMTMKAPAPPATSDEKGPKTQLAFALRLADRTPNREAAALANSPTTRLPEAIRADLKTPSVFLPGDAAAQPPIVAVNEAPQPAVFSPGDVTVQPPIIALKDAPQPVGDSKTALPVKTVQPATAVVVAAPPSDAAPMDSGAHSGGGTADQGTPRHTPPQPLVDPKSFRQAGAAIDPVKTTSKETPLQTSGTASIAVAAEQPAQQPSNRLTTATPVDRIAAPPGVAQPNAASKVTDVSVIIPVPRADSTGDDRIAIRMLQRGAEIHVSVRTPDTQLAQSLRQDLSKLATGLDQGGFRTETWRPSATTSTAQSNSSPQHESGNPNGGGAGSDSRSAGHGGQGEQKRRQQDERPRWVAELEQQQHQ